MSETPGRSDVVTVGSVYAHAVCLSCGAYLQGAADPRPDDLRELRAWARSHAGDNPGHRVVVEVARRRSYLRAAR